jgi:diaminohydroxyphosphoribosylaminopyrimidine deaminase / 5-amino-6-(5-phosphoribosylamino)uracil reductase
MQRCLELAAKGAGFTAPNPMVGAVLVDKDKIIGEGWHQRYGEAHAEVNCIDSVKEEGKILIAQSTLYVSLEPCAHHGKTPPCTDLIIRYKIPRVIIGCRDPFKEVDGKGIEKLKAAGVEVVVGILENECTVLNKRFFTFHTKQRPYIILKWAQTADGKIAASLNPPQENASQNLSQGGALNPTADRLLISNEYSNRLVHKWRSEEASILVGTNTALLDKPELTTRLWSAPSPIRLVVDMDLKLPSSLKIFNQQVKTIFFNTIKHEEKDNLLYYQVKKNKGLIHQITNALYQLKIQSVMVEGGAKLLQSFIDERMWDEARIISNEKLIINNGLNAPKLKDVELIFEENIFSDTIKTYLPKSS